MRYIYENPKGEEEEFNDPCERMKQNLIDDGYIFIKHIDRCGKEYPAERGRRARLTQTKAFDEMIDGRMEWPDERTLLKQMGFRQ